MGARARRAPRLSRGLLARSSAVSVAAGGKRRRSARRRADALCLSGHERGRAISRLARGDPDLGCALVIAHPHSLVGEVVLGNRVAGFFGLISYPLYLWHWPLFAFAHIWPGVIPTAPVLLALAGAAVCLAALTYRGVELPVAAEFRRRPFATALVLLSLLALTGLVGRQTYDAHGFPSRFPPLVARIFDYDVNGAMGQRLTRCFYGGARRAIRSRRSASGRRAFSKTIVARQSTTRGTDDPHRRQLARRASLRRA